MRTPEILTLSCSDGSYPTVSSHTGEWALNSSSHAIDWIVGRVDPQERSGTLEFAVGGDDDELGVRAAHLGEGALQLLESGLRLGAGDREGVVGSRAEPQGAASGDAEHDQPGDEHAPGVAERPAAERGEKGGHAAFAESRYTDVLNT